MAYYTGYVDIPHGTYAEWKSATNGNGYNFDNLHGCQCYDFVVEFWYNVGFPHGYPLIDNSSAYTMWDYRFENSINLMSGEIVFDLITNVNDIKVGDIVVFDATPDTPYGHVGFADVNYTDDGWTYPELPVLSENNGGTPDPQGGAYTNIHGYDITLFLGAFRYKAWEVTPPTPTLTSKPVPHHFNWAVFTNKIRKRR